MLGCCGVSVLGEGSTETDLADMVVKKFALDLYGRRSLFLLLGFIIAVSNTGSNTGIVKVLCSWFNPC